MPCREITINCRIKHISFFKTHIVKLRKWCGSVTSTMERCCYCCNFAAHAEVLADLVLKHPIRCEAKHDVTVAPLMVMMTKSVGWMRDKRQICSCLCMYVCVWTGLPTAKNRRLISKWVAHTSNNAYIYMCMYVCVYMVTLKITINIT